MKGLIYGLLAFLRKFCVLLVKLMVTLLLVIHLLLEEHPFTLQNPTKSYLELQKANMPGLILEST